MMRRHPVPFPPTLFSDCRSFKSTSKPKTSMQFASPSQEKKETRLSSFPFCILNNPSQPFEFSRSDSEPTPAINLHLPREFTICKNSSLNISPKIAEKEHSSFLTNTALRLTDTQFTVFLDYPQAKSDSTTHSSCSESAGISQRNIITHNSSAKTSIHPHASLFMLLNCAQPGKLSSDPTKATKRLNDYTGDFKKEFCTLLYTNSAARAEWDRFWRKHGCTGKRPCIKAYLAFCELYKEFGDLRQNPRYRVLGTRTACRCTRTIHSFQPPRATRYAPY